MTWRASLRCPDCGRTGEAEADGPGFAVAAAERALVGCARRWHAQPSLSLRRIDPSRERLAVLERPFAA